MPRRRGLFRVRGYLLLIGLVSGVCAAAASVGFAGIGVWGPSHGPPGGDVLALAIDPTDPKTMYAGADSGAGVFKSVDGGAAGEQ
jgi:hypothetical protein